MATFLDDASKKVAKSRVSQQSKLSAFIGRCIKLGDDDKKSILCNLLKIHFASESLGFLTAAGKIMGQEGKPLALFLPAGGSPITFSIGIQDGQEIEELAMCSTEHGIESLKCASSVVAVASELNQSKSDFILQEMAQLYCHKFETLGQLKIMKESLDPTVSREWLSQAMSLFESEIVKILPQAGLS